MPAASLTIFQPPHADDALQTARSMHRAQRLVPWWPQWPPDQVQGHHRAVSRLHASRLMGLAACRAPATGAPSMRPTAARPPGGPTPSSPCCTSGCCRAPTGCWTPTRPTSSTCPCTPAASCTLCWAGQTSLGGTAQEVRLQPWQHGGLGRAAGACSAHSQMQSTWLPSCLSSL